MKLSHFFTFGKLKKMHNVPCDCTPCSFKKMIISTNIIKMGYFEVFRLLKLYQSLFKNTLKLVFHPNIFKTMKKSKFDQIFKS